MTRQSRDNGLRHRIRIGVSSCLLGQEVRYDGGHKRNTYITEGLSQYIDFVPFCPEIAIGMGVPRPPIRLLEKNGSWHAVEVDEPGHDFTDALQEYGSEVVSQLHEISGYIFKKDSPSCGIDRVRVFNDKKVPERRGRGIFAGTVMELRPLLPVEEEDRLQDPVLRENFIERIFVYSRWQQLVKSGLQLATLIEFHSRHKFTVLSHDEQAYRKLGRLVAEAGNHDIQSLASSYIEILMQALRKPASRKKHTNVLMHIMGHLKNHLASTDKQELLDILDNYRLGKIPLIVPITLFRHHLRHHPQTYISQQYYMNPYPEELMLRNLL